MRHIRAMWVLLLMFVATSAWGADVSGRWAGSMALNNGENNPANAHLEQNGKVVTGSMGPSDEKQFPLTKGSIEGAQVTIEAKPGPKVLRLSMKLEGTKLTGEVFEDDEPIGTVSLQKAGP
jgi:hypothetical protein